jgi:hypothetical protein
VSFDQNGGTEITSGKCLMIWTALVDLPARIIHHALAGITFRIEDDDTLTLLSDLRRHTAAEVELLTAGAREALQQERVRQERSLVVGSFVQRPVW